MKLLAVDFDKTFFISQDYQKNIDYANAFIEKGNLFIIVTGRHIQSLLSDINHTTLKYHYLVCNDGGIIFDNNLNVIYQCNMPKHVVPSIVNLYKRSDCLDDWYIDTGLTITKDINSSANGIIGHIRIKEGAHKLFTEIKNNYPEIDGYVSQNWINITEKSVNKGGSLFNLSKIININEKDVYTIGDNINDLSMSNYGFNSFCMTDSIDELKYKTIKTYDSVYELIMDILKGGL
ncbi:MAG: HAD family hydrolase [Bacilli bacterium]|nr:HAD family hydrolase [Bacilli bacterium]MDD4298685.1 HAD family hydrolase [Bacilli bacterium]MDD4644013.1 HAD family hydrolase [Bacilli bacterium]